MSIDTLTPTQAGSGDWDDFLRFAEIVERYNCDDLPEPDTDVRRRPKRPARSNDERDAIRRSLRGEA